VLSSKYSDLLERVIREGGGSSARCNQPIEAAGKFVDASMKGFQVRRTLPFCLIVNKVLLSSFCSHSLSYEVYLPA
jgi:hypothetical protein